MGILANPQYFEQDRAGNAEQVLVAARYVGRSRMYSGSAPVNQGRWPTRQSWLADQWYVAFVPETVPDNDPGAGVAWFERADDFEVEYDPEQIAAILLDRNYVTLDPAGPIGDGESVPGFDQALRDALGLEDPIDAGQRYDEQLRDLAGIDETGEPEADPAEALVQDYGRSELKAAVKAVRADTDEFSLRGKSMADMADYLVEAADDPEAAVREANA